MATLNTWVLVFVVAMGSACVTAEVRTTSRTFVGPSFFDGEKRYEAVTVDAKGVITHLHASLPAGDGQTFIQLPGDLALPGLHDAHLHLSGIGRAAERADLRGAQSIAEVRGRLASFVLRHPDARAIVGRGWDQTRFPGQKFPAASDLDGLTDKPVLLTRVDGHAIWVNRVLLERSVVTQGTPDPAGGQILRGPGGKPTGIFVDRAMGPIRQLLAAPSDQDLERWISAGAWACAKAGLVAVHDMGMSPRHLRALLRLEARKDLPPMRFFIYLDGHSTKSLEWLAQVPAGRPLSARVRLMGLKLFADGALGSRGAALLASYSDRPHQRGTLLLSPEELRSTLTTVHNMGYQVAVHAIGDRGVQSVLAAVDAAQASSASGRHRLEHAQVVAPTDFSRIHDLGMVASMQPTHATSDMRWAADRLGETRLKGAYAWRTMLDHRVRLAFGSDAPVESHNPMLGIWAALTRAAPVAGEHVPWGPDELVNEREAIEAFTQGAAYAVFQEERLGRLARGFVLDLTLIQGPSFPAKGAWLTGVSAGRVIGGVLDLGAPDPLPSASPSPKGFHGTD